MEADFTRLRPPEWIVGIASILLLIAMAMPWYGLSHGLDLTVGQIGSQSSGNGWDTLAILRWLVLLTALFGVSAAITQATRPSPALPVCLTVLSFALGLLTFLGLLIRTADPPSSVLVLRWGGVAGVVCALLLCAGAYASLRLDGIRAQDGPDELETVALRTTPTVSESGALPVRPASPARPG